MPRLSAGWSPKPSPGGPSRSAQVIDATARVLADLPAEHPVGWPAGSGAQVARTLRPPALAQAFAELFAHRLRLALDRSVSCSPRRVVSSHGVAHAHIRYHAWALGPHVRRCAMFS